MLTHADFFQAIRDEPDDDTPRLVYSDWLEEHGDLARAEFIRVQCALAELAPDDPHEALLKAREEELLAAHREAWWPWHSGGMQVRFVRGFPEEVSAEWDVFLFHADRIVELTPLLRLQLQFANTTQQISRLGIQRLSGSPACASVVALGLRGHTLDQEKLEDLLASDWPVLRTLRVSHCAVHAGRVRILAAAPVLPRLTTLDLACNHVAAEGLLALLEAPGFRVADLDVSGNTDFAPYAELHSPIPNIGSHGVTALANHPAAFHLRRLNLRNNGLNDHAYEALLASPYFDSIQELLLGDVGDDQGSRPELLELQQGLRARFGTRLQVEPSWPV
jgi:uncharacterized protein (TIGR02996 family)